jgi:hypothetical protein
MERYVPVNTIRPEGAPGPQDNQYLFDRFVDLIEGSGQRAEGRGVPPGLRGAR